MNEEIVLCIRKYIVNIMNMDCQKGNDWWNES